jgi:hypothetical protein
MTDDTGSTGDNAITISRSANVATAIDLLSTTNITGPMVSKGASASIDIYNQNTNAASLRIFSDFAGIWRFRNLVSSTNILTLDTDGRHTNSGGMSIARGTHADGALRIDGTTYPSHFNYSSGENTYIRGGKSTSDVIIADVGSGNVTLGPSGAGTVTVVGLLAVGNFGAWTLFTYNTDWSDYNSSNSPGRYRKVGDIVYVEGFVKRASSGTSALITTLAYGPVKDKHFVTDTNSATLSGRIEITSAGTITLIEPTFGSPATIGYVCLDGIFFSTL